ncbi:DUF4234 domain-containing protein [Candidatus Saccharibacteria bacterium]|nr:DUF4234 domain-containing protein [Candidatus Saccharibacteria bacterium]
MKHRNPFAVFVLSIVTLGIYDLYWLASTRKVLNKTTSVKVPSVWLLIAPSLLIFGAIFMVLFSSVQNQAESGATAQPPDGAAAVVGLLWFLGIVLVSGISFFWFWRYSKAVHEYTKGEMSFPVAFLLLWILHLIGVVFIQDQFNNHPTPVAAAGAGPVPPAPAGEPMGTPAHTPASDHQMPAQPEYQQPDSPPPPAPQDQPPAPGATPPQ